MADGNRKIVRSLFAAVCIASLLSGFAAFAAEAPIVIGSIWSQVGVAAPPGQAGLRGGRLAVKIVNERGGVFGRPLELKNIDGQSDITVISNAAIRLIEEVGVVAACGLCDDSLVSAAGSLFQSGKTPFLVASATTPTIPSIGDYIFMVPFGDNYQGRAVASFCAATLGWKKVAVIRDGASAYSTELSKFFIEAFREITGDENAVVHQEIYRTGDVNFTAQLTRLRRRCDADTIDGIVIIPPFPQDSPIIAKQARRLGIRLPIMLTDGADDPTVIEVGGEHVEGAFISTHFAAEYPLTENARRFVEAYAAEYGTEPGAFECLGFDSVMILAETIGAIGREKWDSMSLVQKRTALRDTIQIHAYVTTTMPISYPDPETVRYPRIPEKPVVFKEIKNGHRVFRAILDPKDVYEAPRAGRAHDSPPEFRR